MTKEHPPGRHHCNNLDDLKPLVEQLGYRVSGGSWESDDNAYAFSQETNGPATYNASRCVVHLNKRTGWLMVTT